MENRNKTLDIREFLVQEILPKIKTLWLIMFAFAPISVNAADVATVGDVYWTVWHENCRVFAPAPVNNPFHAEMYPIGVLRACSYDAQVKSPNMSAANRIASLSDDELKAIYLRLQTDLCTWGGADPRNVFASVAWVSRHEGQLNNFKVLASQGRYEEIRQIYERLQRHNPNARNLLNALTNEAIRHLIDNS